MWSLFVLSFTLSAKIIKKNHSTKQFREIFGINSFRQQEPKAPAA
jgi:hypothetical protein